jgi:rare lipoprotein A
MTRWSTAAAVLGVVLSLASADWPAPAEAKTRHHATAAAQVRAHRHYHVAAAHTSQSRGHHVAAVHLSRVQKGKASIYAASLRGRRMADGTRFNPVSDAAASKTLPLGTTARVTNFDNGRTTTVRVRDRGPHVRGRILDVSPRSGEALGMKRDGVAPVAVAPASDPLARGH